MQWQRISYQIGCWAFMIVGTGHLLTQWLAPRTTAQQAILEVMRQFAIKMPGRDGNLYQYHMGFSTMMGVLLIAYGAQALLMGSGRAADRAGDTRLLALHTLVSALAMVISIFFFFLVPVAFTTVAFLAFALALISACRAS